MINKGFPSLSLNRMDSCPLSIGCPNTYDPKMDGVKLVYGDGSWVLFRPSGTEPIFRIYAESVSPERVKQLIEDHKALVKKVVDELSAA